MKLEGFASMDWGHAKPGCVLWWVCLPDGRYHILREYKFTRMLASDVGKQIHTITKELGLTLRYVAADPSMWQKSGHGRGESIAETLLRVRVPMRRSDNDRRNGWMRVRELLGLRPDGVPWLTVEPTCRYLMRTLPALVADSHDPEDLDTDGDDHAADALRYGAMSRPAPSAGARPDEPGPGTWGWHTTHDHPVTTGVLS